MVPYDTMQSDGKRRKRSQEAQEEGEQESEGRVFEKSGTIGQAGGKEESRASRACRELLLAVCWGAGDRWGALSQLR